jgi:hypothetical protein
MLFGAGKKVGSAFLRISLVTFILIFILHFPLPVRPTVLCCIRSFPFSRYTWSKKRCTRFPSLSV